MQKLTQNTPATMKKPNKKVKLITGVSVEHRKRKSKDDIELYVERVTQNQYYVNKYHEMWDTPASEMNKK